jgi:hypothetical protein
MTGLTLKQLDWVYVRCRYGLEQYRLAMRASGENTLPMSPHNLLCIAIHWLRKGRRYREMEMEFNRTHQWLQDMVKKVVAIIDHSIFDDLIRPIDSTSPPSTMSHYYDVFGCVDSTSVPLSRAPFKPSHYHPKSPTKAAWKVQITCDLSHRIVHVSHVVRGAEADVTLLRASGLLEQVDDEHKLMGDMGYRGEKNVVTPVSRKKLKSQELRMLEDEWTKRHELESERAAIEQVNARVKQWAIFGERWRGDDTTTEHIDHCVRAICALAQRLLEDAPLHKTDRTI